MFFESSASGPFAIRRIEELNKMATGIEQFLRHCWNRMITLEQATDTFKRYYLRELDEVYDLEDPENFGVELLKKFHEIE